MRLDIRVGDHDVAVEVLPHAEGALHVTATCGKTIRQGKLALHAKHDRTAEHLQKDIQEFAERLAGEAAGHEQSRRLMADFFSEGKP